MDFDTLNNKIIKKIEENYSKSAFKAMKVFKIILTGYNFQCVFFFYFFTLRLTILYINLTLNCIFSF